MTSQITWKCLLVVVSFKRCHFGASGVSTIYDQSFMENLEGRNNNLVMESVKGLLQKNVKIVFGKQKY